MQRAVACCRSGAFEFGQRFRFPTSLTLSAARCLVVNGDSPRHHSEFSAGKRMDNTISAALRSPHFLRPQRDKPLQTRGRMTGVYPKLKENPYYDYELKSGAIVPERSSEFEWREVVPTVFIFVVLYFLLYLFHNNCTPLEDDLEDDLTPPRRS